MAIKLYYFEASPPARAVLMTISALELNLELVRVNLSDKDHLKEDYLKLNPTHTVPTLDDNGFVVWDSHAIAQYLADKYGKNGELYPKSLEQRTIVNQMLFFETSVLFSSLALAVRPIFYDDATAVPQDRLIAINTSLEFLERFLENNEYMAGNRLSIADICALATVSTIEIFYNVDRMRYPKVNEWLDKLKMMSFYESNLEGIKKFTSMFIPLLK